MKIMDAVQHDMKERASVRHGATPAPKMRKKRASRTQPATAWSANRPRVGKNQLDFCCCYMVNFKICCGRWGVGAVTTNYVS